MTPAKNYPTTSLANISRAAYGRNLVWANETKCLKIIGSVLAISASLATYCTLSSKRTIKCLGKSVFGPTAIIAAIVFGARAFFVSYPAYQWTQLYHHLTNGHYDKSLKIFESFVDKQKLKDINEENAWQKINDSIECHPFIKSRFANVAFWLANKKELSQNYYIGYIPRMTVLDTIFLLKLYTSKENKPTKSIEMAFLGGGDWRGTPNQTDYGGDRHWQKQYYKNEIEPCSLPSKIEVSEKACLYPKKNDNTQSKANRNIGNS